MRIQSHCVALRSSPLKRHAAVALNRGQFIPVRPLQLRQAGEHSVERRDHAASNSRNRIMRLVQDYPIALMVSDALAVSDVSNGITFLCRRILEYERVFQQSPPDSGPPKSNRLS